MELRTGILVTIAALLASRLLLGLGFYRRMWCVYAASLVPGAMYPHTPAGLLACFSGHALAACLRQPVPRTA